MAREWETLTLGVEGTGGAVAHDFGPNVLIFDPSMSMGTIQSKIDKVFQGQHGVRRR